MLMTLRVSITVFLAMVFACTDPRVPAADAGTAAAGGEGSGGSPDSKALGTDCVGTRGPLENYFCGQACTGATGQRSGVNCGRACVGEPDEVQGANCTPPMVYGGAYGRCLEDGEKLEAKVIGAVCCDGLQRVTLEQPSAEGCVSDAPPSLFICTACGDAKCAAWENACNCPSDCH